MTRNARIGFLLAAVVTLVVAFVLIGTGGDDADEPEQARTPTVTATPAAGGPEAEPQAATPEPTPTEPPVPRVVTRGGAATGDVETLEFDKGDTARFVITSDVPEEIHVHGYDIYEDLGPGQPARFAFDADIDGIYEIELHGSGTQVARLRVNP